MVTIRLARGGAKKRPFYHIVATDSRNPRDGSNLERLGYFNPIARGEEHRLFMNLERVEYWVANGAQPSERVASLIAEAKKMPAMEVQKPKRIAKVAPVRTAKPAAPAESKDKAKVAKGKKPTGKDGKPAAKKAPAKKAATNEASEAKE